MSQSRPREHVVIVNTQNDDDRVVLFIVRLILCVFLRAQKIPTHSSHTPSYVLLLAATDTHVERTTHATGTERWVRCVLWTKRHDTIRTLSRSVAIATHSLTHSERPTAQLDRMWKC